MANNKNQQAFFALLRAGLWEKECLLLPYSPIDFEVVKKLAEENGLHNAYKKESMGVCFVGEVGMKDFLKEYKG